MFAQETKLFRFMLGYLQRLVGDLTDEELSRPVSGAVNPPAYVLGHLAISNDFALQILGEAPVCPQEWHEAFGPGSSPESLRIPLPTKAELMTAIETGHARVCEAVKTASPEALAEPQTFPFFRNTPIETLGDCISLLMTTHFATHIGQLSVMRRQLGHTPLF